VYDASGAAAAAQAASDPLGSATTAVGTGTHYLFPEYSATASVLTPSNISTDTTGNNLTFPGTLSGPSGSSALLTSENKRLHAEGYPAGCVTTSGGTTTTQGDCAFFKAVDLATSTGNSVDLLIGDNGSTGGLSACQEWVEPTAGFYSVNIIGTSMNGSYIFKTCSTPTTPMLVKTAGPAFIKIENVTFNANSDASSCFDLTGGVIGGTIENVNCKGFLPTATSGSDHAMQLGSSGSYAEDLSIKYLLISPPYAVSQTRAAITGTLTGTSLTALSCGASCGNYPAATYGVGIVNDPNGYCAGNEPTFTPNFTGTAISSFTITSAGSCTALPDFQVIEQFPITYGLKAYLSDSEIHYFEPLAGITGGYFINQGNNTFYHAHPTGIQYGLYFNDTVAQAAYIDSTECDTISTWCMGFAGTGGKSVIGTSNIVTNLNMPGESIYYLASGANNIKFGFQDHLCNFDTTPTDMQEFIGPTSPLIPGGTGWPSNSSVYANDQSCTAIPSAQRIDYAPSLTVNALTVTSCTGCGAGITNTTTAVTSATQNAGTCSSATTQTVTGLATTNVVVPGYSTDPTGIAGWGSSGGMVFNAWPSAANTMSWKVCNPTTANITFGSITFNVGFR
jgi:hypothetical protein